MAGTSSSLVEQWSEEDYLKEIESKYREQAARAVRRIINWAREKDLEILFSGKQDKSCSLILHLNGNAVKLIVIWTSGTIYLPFEFGKNGPFFEKPNKREELVERFKAIPVSFDSSKGKPGTQSNPKIHLGSLRSQERVEKFIQVLTWELNELLSE